MQLRRLHGQAGFTLVELTVAILIGGIVLTVATAVITGATRRSDAVQRRTTALYNATLGMDATVRSLRAQSCVPTETTPRPPLVEGTSTSVTFYADLGGATATPLRRQIALDTTTGELTERVWPAGDLDGTSTPRIRVLARNVSRDGSTPVFAFYAFNTANPPVADALLPTPLDSTGRTTAARIVITFKANPPGVQDGTRTTTVTDAVFTRLADADGAAVPQCV